MKALRSIALLALAAAVVDVPAAGRDYFVDYAQGNDGAAGTRAAPWKHAPGDPAAQGRAAAAALAPGDVVRFRAGVSYRGTINVRTSGTAAQPITFTGAGFGEGRGIIDGADPVRQATPCPSSSACGNVASFQALRLVRFDRPDMGEIQLYDARGPLAETQWPVPPDPFYADEVDSWAKSPKEAAASIETGRLRAPELVRMVGANPGGALLFWVRGNESVRRPITGVQGNDLLFDPAGLDLYDDRPGRYALVGSPRLPLAPGHFFRLDPATAVANPVGGGDIYIGSGRRGFLIQAASHIVIRNLAFVRQTSVARQNDQGVAIEARRGPVGDIRIEGNTFGPAAMYNHQGMIRLTDVQGATIANNHFAGLLQGSGIRTGSRNSGVKVEGNQFTRIGRTAIAFFGVSDGVIDRNIIDDARGLHGNGISLYLDNRRIRVSDNRIVNTTRPMTFHGDKRPSPQPGNHDFVIERNVFVSTPTGQAALTSWGAQTRGVTIRQNLLIGGKVGLLLHGTDQRVSAADNLVTKLAVTKPEAQAGWALGKNPTTTARPGAALDPAKSCSTLGLARSVPFGATTC